MSLSISAHVAKYSLASIVEVNPQLDGIRKYCKPSMVWAFAHADNYRFGTYRYSHQQFEDLGKLIDDYGYSAPGGCNNAQLWAYGHEYGYSHLVHCQHEGDGYSAHIDESPTIDESEVHEAYDSHEKLSKYLISKGHEDNQELNLFCLRWAETFFRIATRDANYTGAWDNWNLSEGYEYQSNSSGTGIVNTGHYGHYRQVSWNELMILPKSYRTY